METYAVGDIHGHLDMLRELVELKLPLKSGDRLVFIGDYVDRGPDSMGVIAYLIDLACEYDCVFLRGNHEEMFMAWLGLDTLSRANDVDWLVAHGGDVALRSYGIETSGFMARMRLKRYAGRSEWLPAGHVEFLSSTVSYLEDTDAYYVHAGFRAGIPMNAQSADDMFWIRQGWIDTVVAFDKPVVHGHTPTPLDGGALAVRMLPHRINIDTGAGRHKNGYLSALRTSDRVIFDAGKPESEERFAL